MPSKIEWTTETWNPTTGCDQVSPGCDNCYALTMSARLKAMGQPKYQRDGRPETSGPGFGIQTHLDTLEEPLWWSKPRRVFVDSMSDLFHPGVPDEFLADVFAVMSMATQHTFQILTKRPARMLGAMWHPMFKLMVNGSRMRRGVSVLPDSRQHDGTYAWPLRNVWLGVSVEDQRRADERIPLLLDTPAAVRFLSCEPLLGPVGLHPRPPGTEHLCIVCGEGPDAAHDHPHGYRNRGIDWVIVGGESGPNARPMHPDWARGIRNQCQQAGVPFFFKQWGSWAPADYRDGTHLVHYGGIDRQAASVVPREKATTRTLVDSHADRYRDDDLVDRGHPGWVRMRRSSGHGGRELDGETWDQFPDEQGALL